MMPKIVLTDGDRRFAEDEIIDLRQIVLSCMPRAARARVRAPSTSNELAERRWIQPEEWATTCGFSRRQVFRLLSGGQIPPYDYRLGQKRGWKQSTLMAWLDSLNAPSRNLVHENAPPEILPQVTL